jgi:DNA-binding NtrC family response regulator
MSGRELADQARALLPNIKVLFMTGYSENDFADEGRIDHDVEVIEKPFRSDRLAAHVRAALVDYQVK